jgi:hypothetical protein
MLPPNTVPITAEELDTVINGKNIDCLIHVLFNNNNWGILNDVFTLIKFRNEIKEMRIAAHDYRHYFGEVVDLASKFTAISKLCISLNYLNNEFDLSKIDGTNQWQVQKVTEHNIDRVTSGTEPECKQWLIDHFTAIAAKDLPNYNLKFIFS